MKFLEQDMQIETCCLQDSFVIFLCSFLDERKLTKTADFIKFRKPLQEYKKITSDFYLLFLWPFIVNLFQCAQVAVQCTLDMERIVDEIRIHWQKLLGYFIPTLLFY